MNVLVSGSRGLIGSALVARLRSRGDTVTPLVRSTTPGGLERVGWDPAAGKIESERLEGFDAVVHLAGENISGRWTPAKKRKILESRIWGTRLLFEALATCRRPPHVVVSASAIGYYGSRGSEILTESSSSGEDFLARVCRDWEDVARIPDDAGSGANAGTSGGDAGFGRIPGDADPPRRRTRVAHIRTGPVLDTKGGVLARLLPPFRLGLGARLGDGGHFMSWVTLDEIVAIYLHVIENDGLSGPVNGVAPHPVTNRIFTETLAKTLGRRAPFRIPAALLRAGLGEMADVMLLASQRAIPQRLEAGGYRFLCPDLGGALEHLLR
jgi:uncharacterized protein